MPHDISDFDVEEVEPCEKWSSTCPTIFDGVPIQPRRFIVDGWLPASTVTILYGDGGTGKTLLSQQLMTSCATGLPWLGLAVEKCPTLALFCEDDDQELHRRQNAINLSLGIAFPDLVDMRWTTGVGRDNTLAEFDAGGRLKLTDAFLQLAAKAIEMRAGLIVVDTAADTFGGNENNRREVRQFVGHALGRLALKTGAAVLLNAHPSRSGLSPTGDLDGGSTAWSNTARSRWSLARPKGEGQDLPDTNERILTRRKANYSSIGDTIKCGWQNGVLVPLRAVTGLAAISASQHAEATFLELLARTTAEQRSVSHSSNASNYAPKVFISCIDRAGFNRSEFKQAMERLFHADRIHVETFGRRGDCRQRLAIGPKTPPCNDCGGLS